MTDKEKLDAIELLYKQYFGFLHNDDMRVCFELALEEIFAVDCTDCDTVESWRAKEPAWRPLQEDRNDR